MSEIENIKKEISAMRGDVQQILNILNDVFISAEQLTKIKNLNVNTISRNNKIEKYNEIGKRKLLISLSSVPMIKKRKKRITSK